MAEQREPKSIQGQYHSIHGLKGQFSTELEQAIASGDSRRAREIKQQLEGKIGELRKEIDPYQYSLRKDIAKDKGFKYVGMFADNGYARARMGSGLWVYVNKDTRELLGVGAGIGEAFPFKEDIARVKTAEGRYDFVKLQNQGLRSIGGNFAFARDFSEELAAVCTRETGGAVVWNYINTEGQYLEHAAAQTPITFINAKSFSQGLAPVRRFSNNGNWSFIDKNGVLQKNSEGEIGRFQDAGEFSEGVAAVKLFGRVEGQEWTYIDTKLEGVANRYWSEALAFKEGVGVVKIGNGWFYKDLDNNTKPNHHYIEAFSFSEGLALVTPPNFDAPNTASNQFINHEGEVKIELDLNETAEPFNEGVAKVTRIETQESYFIDHKGNRIF